MEIFSNKKLLIFDLDGTLIDSAPDLALSINLMLQDLKKTTYPEDRIRKWVGNGSAMLVKRSLVGKGAVADCEVDITLFERAHKTFLEHYQRNLAQKTCLYPHVLETLKRLQKQGYRLTIITNKPIKFVKPILDKLMLSSLIEYYLGGDSLLEKKPHPLPLLHLCKTLKIDPNDAVMIGDSRNDLLAGSAVPMSTIAVTYGYNQGENLLDYNPTATIDNFADILPLFNR